MSEEAKVCTICERPCDESDRMKRYDSDLHDWVLIEPPEYLCGFCEDGAMT